MKLLFALLFSVMLLAAADVSGTWTGSFEPQGGDAGSAWLQLKQNGQTLTGKAGPSADQSWEIRNGKIEGQKVTFELPHDGEVMTIELTLNGDTLEGNAKGEHEGETRTAHLKLKREA